MTDHDFQVRVDPTENPERVQFEVTLRQPASTLEMRYGDGTQERMALPVSADGHRVFSTHQFAPGTYRGLTIAYDQQGRMLDRRVWNWTQP
jgi:hypothetical protein